MNEQAYDGLDALYMRIFLLVAALASVYGISLLWLEAAIVMQFIFVLAVFYWIARPPLPEQWQKWPLFSETITATTAVGSLLYFIVAPEITVWPFLALAVSGSIAYVAYLDIIRRDRNNAKTNRLVSVALWCNVLVWVCIPAAIAFDVQIFALLGATLFATSLLLGSLASAQDKELAGPRRLTAAERAYARSIKM